MTRHLLLRVFAISLALVVAHSAQAEKKIYKWKDAAGVVHFSAAPPPVGVEGATEVNVAGKAAPTDPAADPSKAAAPTDAGKTATDTAAPPVDPKAVAPPPPPPKTAEDLQRERAEEAAKQKAEECQVKRDSLLSANRRMHGESNEILTPQERIDLPKLTQQLENEIRANCQ